ncbi:hypothetical protein D3C87_1802850 [compost metagenome]
MAFMPGHLARRRAEHQHAGKRFALPIDHAPDGLDLRALGIVKATPPHAAGKLGVADPQQAPLGIQV